jgi:hypothetical protein
MLSIILIISFNKKGDDCGSNGDIILCGDLNARLGKENDYIPLDSASHIPVFNECYNIDIAVNDRNSLK